MLNKTIRKIFVLVVLMLAVFSCSYKNDDQEVKLLRNIKNREAYLSSNFYKYQEIRNQIVDSLTKWKKDSINLSKSYRFNDWMIDEVILFNADSTMLYTVLLKPSPFYDAKMDGLSEIWGKKIKGDWCFFFNGVSMVLPRKGLKKAYFEPFTFPELSYFAYIEKFAPFLSKNDSINQRLTNDYIEGQFNFLIECKDRKGDSQLLCIDSLTKVNTAEKYKYKLTPEEILYIENDIQNSKARKVKTQENESNDRECLFDSKEWKLHVESLK